MAAEEPSRGKARETGLLELLEPVVRSEGLILVDVTLRTESHGRILRLIVDRAEGGVTLDDCSAVSRQVSDILDVEDQVEGAYRLEVSSPGLTRKLKTERDFSIFAGRKARVTFRDEAGEVVTLEGILKGMGGPEVILECNGGLRTVPFGSITKARLVI